MNLDFEEEMKRQERIVVEQRGLLIVKDGFGNYVAKYNTVDLAIQWFNMSNDAFFSTYGFNWIPRGQVYETARRKAGKI